MIEAAMIWNEPNNKSHWDPELDPDWSRFAELVTLAGQAIKTANPAVTRVLGGMSPIDPVWTKELKERGVLAELRDAGTAIVAVTHDADVIAALHADRFALGGDA